MLENNSEPEAQPSTSQSSEALLSTPQSSEAHPSTSQSSDTQNTAAFPLVSLPKIVLQRLDLNNLPIPLNKKTSPVKKPIKRLVENKSKPIVSKSLPKITAANVKHDTPRLRGRPKKNYKLLAEYGEPEVTNQLKTSITKSSGGVVKKAPKIVKSEEENTVRGMLKKTMLQNRSKVVIPPTKKSKLMPSKTSPSSSLPLKKEKSNAKASPPKKEILPKVKEVSFKMDTDASEDEFLYDELIDELVNPPNKKGLTSEKKTNITLKPNVGNKPPTIVKGGIVKRSSLPPDLKAVASPTTLNSSKLTGTALNSKSKPAVIENVIKTPATADTPKASLPAKASPFPIAMNPSPSKDLGKKNQKKTTNSVISEEKPLKVNTTPSSTIQSKISPKPKQTITAPRPRGRPRLGPKQAIKPSPIKSSAADEESDEYTEVETLENIDSDSVELLPVATNDSDKNEDIQVLAHKTSKEPMETDHSRIKSKGDEDPHLDLLRILTDETEDAQSERGELKGNNPEKPSNGREEATEPIVNATSESPNGPLSSEKSSDHDIHNPGCLEGERASDPQANENISVQNNERTSDSAKNASDPTPNTETSVEQAPPVRTIYDLMKDVSLQYPSWNLHIIPETNAFCIAQVTKGRLGLPTLKKCIELDADTYSAKVYIHQYHIKRFNGVYDSEEAILALIEEIHSIKA